MTEKERDKYGFDIIVIERIYRNDHKYLAFRLLLLLVARLVGDIYGIKKEVTRDANEEIR